MWFLRRDLVHCFPGFQARQDRGLALRSIPMKELLRSTDPTVLAFASALLEGEDIDCFQMDVNMSILEGGIGIFPRRLMVREDDYILAKRAMLDNEIPLGNDT